MPRKTGLLLWVIAIVLCYCVLSFYQTGAAQSGSRPTLANPVEERKEMISNLEDTKNLIKEQNAQAKEVIANLEEIKNSLKEQNALLKSGQVKVIVTEMPKN